jgi:MFS family permease
MSIGDSSATSNEKQAQEQRGEEAAVLSSQPPPAPLPPNGGTIAWLFVFAAFLLFFVTWGPSAGVGAFQEYYQRSLLSHYSPSTISWIGTVNATFLISTGVLAGPLFDRGYVRHLMLLGSFMVVFGQMMLSLSTEYYQILLSQGFCVGIGAGLIYVPAIAMVNVKFTTRRAIAMGLVTSGASLGMFHAGPQNYINLLICDTQAASYSPLSLSASNHVSASPGPSASSASSSSSAAALPFHSSSLESPPQSQNPHAI